MPYRIQTDAFFDVFLKSMLSALKRITVDQQIRGLTQKLMKLSNQFIGSIEKCLVIPGISGLNPIPHGDCMPCLPS